MPGPILPSQSSLNERGVTGLHKPGEPSAKGDIELIAGSNVTISQAGQRLTIASTGGGGGGTPATTVVTETAYGQASAVGVSANYAREDHTHGTPASGAPVGSSYVVIALDGTLTSERRLQTGTGLTLVDAGANNDVTLSKTPEYANAMLLMGG